MTEDKIVSNDVPVTPKDVSAVTQDRAVSKDAPVAPKDVSVSQAEHLVAVPISQSHSDGVRHATADIQIMSNAVLVDTVSIPASDVTEAPPCVDLETTLVFIAGGHENIAKNVVQDATVTMSQQRGRGREYVERGAVVDNSESRHRSADSSYSTGSSDNNDEYNMIPTPTSIRSTASSSSEQPRRSPHEVNKLARRKLANAAAPKGVSKPKTAVPSGVGRATALQSCLQKLSMADANSVGLANGPLNVSGQFNDVDSDVSMVNGRMPGNVLVSAQVCVPSKVGLGRAATLARHST